MSLSKQTKKLNKIKRRWFVLENLMEIMLRSLEQMGFLWKILAFSFLGLIAAEIIFKAFPNVVKVIGRPLRPLTRLCGLPEEVGSLLLSSLFASTMATNSALASLRESESISERQMITAAILNSVPAYLRRIIVFLMPVFVPLFGWTFFLGVVFCHMLVIVAKIVFCIFYGGKEKGDKDIKNISGLAKPFPLKLSLKTLPSLLNRPLKMFFKVSLTLTVTTFIVLVFVNTGLLGKIAVPVLYPLLKFFGLPKALSSGLMIFSAGNIIIGTGVFQNLMADGIINIREAFIAVVFGILISQPAIVLRHVLPPHVAIFGRRAAFRIIGMSLIIVILVRTLTFFLFKAILF